MFEHIHKKKHYTSRVSKSQVDVLHPPNGDDLVRIKFSRWQFFTGMGEWKWDEILFSREDAIKLCCDIADKYDIDTAAEREINDCR